MPDSHPQPENMALRNRAENFRTIAALLYPELVTGNDVKLAYEGLITRLMDPNLRTPTVARPTLTSYMAGDSNTRKLQRERIASRLKEIENGALNDYIRSHEILDVDNNRFKEILSSFESNSKNVESNMINNHRDEDRANYQNGGRTFQRELQRNDINNSDVVHHDLNSLYRGVYSIYTFTERYDKLCRWILTYKGGVEGKRVSLTAQDRTVWDGVIREDDCSVIIAVTLNGWQRTERHLFLQKHSDPASEVRTGLWCRGTTRGMIACRVVVRPRRDEETAEIIPESDPEYSRFMKALRHKDNIDGQLRADFEDIYMHLTE